MVSAGKYIIGYDGHRVFIPNKELEWRNCRGQYLISNQGDVVQTKGYAKLMKQTNMRNKRQVSLSLNGKKRYWEVGRLVAEAFLTTNRTPGNFKIEYINNDKFDCRVENIRIIGGKR